MSDLNRMVRSADAIVIAVAARAATTIESGKAGGDLFRQNGSGQPTIAFGVVQVLRGASVPDTLFVTGEFVMHDDFNDEPVPYLGVRPSGRRGSCYATEYRQGAVFLFMLKRDDGGRLSPYWWPLGPTNEQLHLPADSWLTWVRGQISDQGRPLPPG